MNKNDESLTEIKQFQNVPELNSQDAIEFFNIGNICYNKEEYQNAIDAYSTAIRLDDKYKNAYFKRGIAYYHIKEYQKAIDDFSETIRLDDKDEMMYYNRGTAYIYIEEYQKAIEDLNKAIRINDKYVHAYHNRGSAYANIKEYQKAIDDFSEIIRLDDKYINAYLNRGITYIDIEEYQKAIEDLNKAIRLDDKCADAYHERGRAYIFIEEYQKAIDDVSEAIRLDNIFVLGYNSRGYAYRYNSRGYAYIRIKEFQKAIEDLNMAIRLDDTFVDAYNNRGNAYASIEEYQKAIDDYSETIRLDNKYFDAYNNRGNIYYKIGEVEKSKADYNTTLYLILSNSSEKIRPYILRNLISVFDSYPYNYHSLFQYISLPTDSFSSQDSTSFISYWKHVGSIQDFLLLLHYYKLKLPHEVFLSFYPILIYNLGGCSEAYKIFDKELDKEEQPLSAQQYYYYIVSALSLSEDANLGQKSIITDAIKKISDQEELTSIDYYYFGMIHFLNDDKQSAIEAFKRCYSPFSQIMINSLNETPSKQELKLYLQTIHSKEIEQINIEREGLSQFQEYLHLLEICRFQNIAENYLGEEEKMLWEVFELTEDSRKVLVGKVRTLECKRLVNQLPTANLSQEDVQQCMERSKIFGTQNLSLKEEFEEKIVMLISSYGQDISNQEKILKLIQYHSYKGDIGTEEMFSLMLWFDRNISKKKINNISKISKGLMIAIFSGCISYYLGNNNLFFCILGSAISVLGGDSLKTESFSKEMNYQEFKKHLLDHSELKDLLKQINKLRLT